MATKAKSLERHGSGSSSYVALLRGVNVGGRGRVPMQELRELFESLGFEDVRTFIQSGNVIFRTASRPSANALEVAIKGRFNVSSTVVLRTSSDLAKIIRADPFGETDQASLHVGFLGSALSSGQMEALDVDRFAPDRIVVLGTEVYFSLPGGLGNSKLASYVSRKLGDSMTVRNWKTVGTLAALAAE